MGCIIQYQKNEKDGFIIGELPTFTNIDELSILM